MKKCFTSLIVFVLVFSLFKISFAETTNQPVADRWVVTLEATELTVTNTETGETKTVPIPVNEKLKVDKEEGELLFVSYMGEAGTIPKEKVRDATLWEINPDAKVFKVISDTDFLIDENGKLIKKGKVIKDSMFEKIGEKDQYIIINYFNKQAYLDKNNTVPLTEEKLPEVNLPGKTVKINIGMTLTSTEIVDPLNLTSAIAEITSNEKIIIKAEYNSYYIVEIGGNIGLIDKKRISLKTNNYVDPNRTYSYDAMVADLKEINGWYPTFTKLESIGKSVDGRTIYAMKLGIGKQEISMNASHHAREHMTTNVLMEMLDQYASGYEKNSKINGYDVRKLLTQTSIYFVPMVNPDGVMLVQQGAKSAKNPSMVIKLNKGSKNFSAWKANIRGIDLNRQYPANWSKLQGNKSVPGPDNHKGKKPLSEPEVIALYNFTNKHSFKNTVSYHSSGNIIFWHYSQKGSQLTRDKKIAMKLSKQTGYSLVPPKKGGGGGYKDWYVSTKKQPGFTIEIAPYVGNRPVPQKYFSDIMKRNLPIGLIMAGQPTK